MEKDHDSGGKCCFCNRYNEHDNPGYFPTWLFWVALIKLILKGILSYILFEALYKVHNFPSMTNSLKQYLIHLAGMRVARRITSTLFFIVTASLFSIYVTYMLNAWGTTLTNIYNWVKHTQTIVVINWQPCTGPGQFCMPWLEGFPLGREVDPIKTCIDYFKGLPMHTQFNCILQVTLTDSPNSYVNI